MRPGQSYRLLSSASGVAAVLLCRGAVPAGSQIQVEKGTDRKFLTGFSEKLDVFPSAIALLLLLVHENIFFFD